MNAVEPSLVARASDPALEIAPGASARVLGDMPSPWILVTQPGPLEWLDEAVVARAERVELAASLARADLEALVARAPSGRPTVVGVGGGMTLDTAKWLAYRRDLPLVLVPSIVSVDASVTNTVAIRDGGTIVYEGFVVADRIVVDPDLIRRAPARLNRAGIGDLVSIHTALFDWRLAARAGRLEFDAAIGQAAANALDRAEALAPDVAAVSDAGIEGIVRLYAEVNALCLRAGHSGPEEGSEHYFAYRVEELTGRSFVHGELVGLGTVLMARVQGNDPARPVRILDACGVAWRPPELDLEREVIVEAVVGLRAFVRAHELPWSIVDEAPLSEAAAEQLVDEAR